MKTLYFTANRSLLGVVPVLFSVLLGTACAQGEGEFKLALPQHKGQLRWKASGFKFRDIFAYAEILYNHHQYAAGPLFERA